MAAAFDLISSEYGWQDEDILELSVKRFNLILSAIAQRKRTEATIRRSEITWQTSVLAQYIVASGTIEEKEGLMQEIQNLSMDPEEPSTTKKAVVIRDIEDVRNEAADRNGSLLKVASAFKNAGSFAAK